MCGLPASDQFSQEENRHDDTTVIPKSIVGHVAIRLRVGVGV